RTFHDFVGDLPEDAEALFRPTVTRSAADPHEMSAGAGIGYFSLVWNIGQGLNQGILGGPSTLTEGIAAALGDRVQLGTEVIEIVHKKRSVVVRYRQDGADQEAEGRLVILATPAMVSHRVAVDIPQDVRDALGKVIYGPYVSAASLTNETPPRPWDGAYAIATPKRSFNIVLTQSSLIRGSELVRQPGGSIMVFSPASLARTLLAKSDEEILRIYADDLDHVLGPGFANSIVEAQVQRWETGAPYCFPGRGALQPTLMRRGSRVLLAGDYLGTLYTETAIQTGFSAAQEALSLLATHRQQGQVRVLPLAASCPPSGLLQRRRQMTVQLRGVLTALATPFAADGNVDEALLRALVDRSIAGGVHGVVACGSTGEFSTLSSDERRLVVETVVDHVGGRGPVIAQTGATSTAEAIRLSRHAQSAGADVVMTVAPYYEPLSIDETLSYL